MNPENENYLKGLRDEDKEKHLNEVHRSLFDHNEAASWVEAALATRHNWEGITPSPPHEGFSRPELPPGVPNENEFISGLRSRELYPIKTNEHNISKQLVQNIDKISSIVDRRPPSDYHVRVSDGPLGSRAVLVHTPDRSMSHEVVGEVKWENHGGHVDWLGVDEGHRHMTNYLMTQAWNHSRSRGSVGPAASDSLSPYSEKIARKYNPEAREYKRYLHDNEKARNSTNNVCTACSGDGLTHISPHSTDNGHTVQYRYPNGDRVNMPEQENTREGQVRGLTYIGRMFGGQPTYGDNIHNPTTGESFHWTSHEIECRNCNGQGTVEREYE
jgi:hypothetical protein